MVFYRWKEARADGRLSWNGLWPDRGPQGPALVLRLHAFRIPTRQPFTQTASSFGSVTGLQNSKCFSVSSLVRNWTDFSTPNHLMLIQLVHGDGPGGALVPPEAAPRRDPVQEPAEDQGITAIHHAEPVLHPLILVRTPLERPGIHYLVIG